MNIEVFQRQVDGFERALKRAQRDAERWRVECEATPRGLGRGRGPLRSRQFAAEDRAEWLSRAVDLARRQVTLGEIVEQQREALSQRYQEHNGRAVKTELASQLSRAHDRLAINEARLRRVNRQLIELQFGPSWKPSALRQFAADDQLLLDADDQESWSWLVIPELLSGRRYAVH